MTTLAPGTQVRIRPPAVPTLQMRPPDPSRVVLPVIGPQGPPGPPGGAPYTHVQAVPAATWTIQHNLGRRPLPTLLPNDSNGRPVWADLIYPDDNTLVVEWPAPTAGTAYL